MDERFVVSDVVPSGSAKRQEMYSNLEGTAGQQGQTALLVDPPCKNDLIFVR